MRTTLTLDPDVAALVQQAVRERGQSLKQVVNDALRAGLGATPAGAVHATPTFAMGEPAVPLDQALLLAGGLEDEELVRRLAARK